MSQKTFYVLRAWSPKDKKWRTLNLHDNKKALLFNVGLHSAQYINNFSRFKIIRVVQKSYPEPIMSFHKLHALLNKK